MSVLIVGSTALDSIKTAAAKIRACSAVRPVTRPWPQLFQSGQPGRGRGRGFPEEIPSTLPQAPDRPQGLQILRARRFIRAGEYEVNMNNRRTLFTELGVFEKFTPHLPDAYKQSAHVLLANIAPALQHHVLDQMARPKFVVADTMDLWLNIALEDLVRLLRRVDGFVLNDSEAHQLTKEDNVFAALRKIHKLGPRHVIIKKGSHGSILSAHTGFSSARPTRCTKSSIRPAPATVSWAA